MDGEVFEPATLADFVDAVFGAWKWSNRKYNYL